MSVTLYTKFAAIYCDEINMYYDEKSAKLDKNFTLHALFKDKFKLTAKQKTDFDKWIIETYPNPDVKKSIIEWQNDVLTNRKSNVFASAVKILIQDDIISFYKQGDNPNELIFLCDTNDDKFCGKLLKYFKWGMRHPFYLKAFPSTVNEELTKALEEDVIPKIDKIVNFTNTSTQYCLSYMDLNNLPNGNTLAWDNFAGTFKYEIYKELFMAWLYSIFKADNKGRQILWIEGMGKSGKSTIIRTIYKCLHNINPELAQSIEKLFYEDKFSLASYKNCRLAIIADSADRGLIKREVIKNLTGQDVVVIREMHKAKVSLEIHCKIMVASNYPPYISVQQEHELSRIIFLKLDDDQCYKARDNWDVIRDGEWDKRLEAELLAFVNKCKPYYEKHISSDGHNFTICDEMIEDLKEGRSNIEESVDQYWASHWIKDDTAPYTPTNWIIEDYAKRFMTGFTNNKIKLYRSFIYVKIRKLKITIADLKLGGIQVINGWKYTNKPITFKELIKNRVSELNETCRE